MNPRLRQSARAALERINARLRAELEAGSGSCWAGRLSSSALSTAVATIALGEIDRRSGIPTHATLVSRGLQWLAGHANADGGWGDTPRSRSNLSTTALAWAAFGAAHADGDFDSNVRGARDWILHAAGDFSSLVPAIERRYGDDRTFSVPIVLSLALSGRLGVDGWRRVRPLPFELAALPRSWFGVLRLPVVSYALPALIAMGQAVHRHAPHRNPCIRWIRGAVAARTLDLLNQLQPPNGGFLEASPLTAFVTMSLASIGRNDHPVALRGAAFLRASVRDDGSWPIDTNLSTWVTTLAIQALARQPRAESAVSHSRIVDWLLQQQFRGIHPYTAAKPGGWAWTDLPGGVPDADDTAGALLALHHLEPGNPACAAAAVQGVAWLLDLQNRDGGIPTFCRGWGRLAFDRSAPDLTAHAMRAWRAWLPRLPLRLRRRTKRALRRAHHFLTTSQRHDGAWLPLWFGNECAEHEENPVYGTAQVVRSLETGPMRERAVEFLRHAQGEDGGWGGAKSVPPSIEETALAVIALEGAESAKDAWERGIAWLCGRFSGESIPAGSPLGLYFARLWYWEELYPWIFAAEALAGGVFPTPAQAGEG